MFTIKEIEIRIVSENGEEHIYHHQGRFWDPIVAHIKWVTEHLLREDEPIPDPKLMEQIEIVAGKRIDSRFEGEDAQKKVEEKIRIIGDARLGDSMTDSLPVGDFDVSSKDETEDNVKTTEEARTDEIKATTLQAKEPQAQISVQIFIREAALDSAKNHADSDKSREVGGILLGTFRKENERWLVFITGIVRALKAVGKAASVNFTPETWADIWRSIDGDPDYSNDKVWKMVGWYHTHPNFGVFLSSLDLAIQRGHFIHPAHVALVIDPVRKKDGFFCWDIRQENVVRYLQGNSVIVSDEEIKELLGLSHLPPAEVETKELASRQANDEFRKSGEEAQTSIEIEMAPEILKERDTGKPTSVFIEEEIEQQNQANELSVSQHAYQRVTNSDIGKKVEQESSVPTTPIGAKELGSHKDIKSKTLSDPKEDHKVQGERNQRIYQEVADDP